MQPHDRDRYEQETTPQEAVIGWLCAVVISAGIWAGLLSYAWTVGRWPAVVIVIAAPLCLMLVAALASRDNPTW